MKVDKQELYRKIVCSVDKLQQKIIAYDRALQEKRKTDNAPQKPTRTIAEQEDIIFHKFGGKKLELDYFYEHLEDFFVKDDNNFEYEKSVSICKIIFNYTEIIIPEEYFYSLYFIPIDESLKDHYVCQKHYRELIIFIASRDGVNVYATLYLIKPINSRHPYEKILQDELYYLEDGVAIYEDDMEEKPTLPFGEESPKTIKITVNMPTAYHFSLETTRQAVEAQQKVLAYDRALQEKRKTDNTPQKPTRTIAEQEDIIFRKFGGKKLELDYFYEHLEEFFERNTDFEALRLLSPCKIIFTCKNLVIPEEYFYSFYLIPYSFNSPTNSDSSQEFMLFFVASRDSVHIYQADILTQVVKQARERPKAIDDELRYAEDGILVDVPDVKN